MAHTRVMGIVVAAGRAERFGGRLPKQFLDLGGMTPLGRASRALTSCPGVEGAVIETEKV